jgi:hypothetical protein
MKKTSPCADDFGDFWVVQKVIQPVKSVDHNTGHSFISIMNKVTRRRNP